MADRTARIAQNNLAIAAATAITVSSSVSSLPAAWLRDSCPTKRWRSQLGWNVVAGFNDKIDFNRAGVKVATIAAGNYATGAALAAAIVTAMAAADGATTWTSTAYDSVNKKFSIVGSAAFTLLFGSGVNLATSAAKDLGFATSDTGSATTQTAGSVAYHSREWALFDLKSAQAFTLGIGHFHNLGTGGTMTLLAKSAPDVWVSAGFSQVLAGDDLSNKRIAFFAAQTFRYVLLLIEDVQNTAGYSELGVPYVGTYLEPSRGFLLGRRRAALGLTEIQRSVNGAVFKLVRPAPKRHRLTFSRMLRADRDIYQTMEDARPHIFFAFNPQNFPGTETLYGVIEQVTEFGEEVTDRWSSGEMVFAEDLG